ncbi:MAG TPA: adenosylcobinamide-GDP ribazoletransferase, partial [Methanomicrobiales archaeon]|nr:adenosylcobinamide-GDP ribazoletransferase [Methanomicrobiales archaeon]
MCLGSFRALLQFTTILPLGKMGDFDEFARRSYLYPFAGYVLGGIALLAVIGIREPLVAS